MGASQRIFVVDDDDGIRQLLAEYLTRHGFSVATSTDGESFLERFHSLPEDETRHALVVLDIMMPGLDGFDVCRELRAVSKVPVIMLTAVSDEMDRIVGLEIGADDYLAKPFNPRELLARIKAIFRRSDQAGEVRQPSRFCCFHGLRLDTVTRSLSDTNGELLPLSGADYNLLMLFINNAGRVLSREYIAGETRKRSSDPLDRFIDVHISRLRQCLGDDAKSPDIIKTVRGAGYLMATEVCFTHNIPEPVRL
ncbi:response regulator [Endozoicomonas sp. SCSIO W0465]|uniref:response regulator n=1 Tax=Endozoicomonas sp. SCSIO W0465 TaxID=2918516 RepID=UPI00207634DC|nr:response regulator transcription factor [Endozoicomonas sp. SCSIO W0465]USE39806.1 response regulator transcription factor [Endozoicomonas sp. SCSIO W0465]